MLFETVYFPSFLTFKEVVHKVTLYFIFIYSIRRVFRYFNPNNIDNKGTETGGEEIRYHNMLIIHL